MTVDQCPWTLAQPLISKQPQQGLKFRPCQPFRVNSYCAIIAVRYSSGWAPRSSRAPPLTSVRYRRRTAYLEHDICPCLCWAHGLSAGHVLQRLVREKRRKPVH